LCLFLLLWATATPARAEWRRAVSEHFIIYSEANPRELGEFAQTLEWFDGVLRRLSPVPPQATTRRLTIFLPREQSTVADVLGATYVAGFYHPSAEGSIAVAPRRMGGRLGADQVLFHEYTHHFMLQNYAAAFPAWFVEGYAELFSNIRFLDDGSIRIGDWADHRARELSLPPVPLRTLLLDDARNIRREHSWTFYSQSWLLTHFLMMSESRGGQLSRYLAALSEGRSRAEAAQAAFGDLDAMERELTRYRRTRAIPTVTIRFSEAPAIGPVEIEALGPGEESLVWQQMHYLHGVEPGDAQGFARRVRERAAAGPNEPAVLQLLADAEYLVDDLDAATRAVDALLAVRPEAPRALLRKGLIEIRRLELAGNRDSEPWLAARRWIRRANRADPDDAFILSEYHRAFERQGIPAPADALRGLERAFELVPQDSALRMRFATLLVGRRQYSRAATVLAPVVFSAHQDKMRDAAATLLESIRRLADGAEMPARTELPRAAAPARN
jgi:tetratricopeptide (TPR) repeat protein